MNRRRANAGRDTDCLGAWHSVHSGRCGCGSSPTSGGRVGGVRRRNGKPLGDSDRGPRGGRGPPGRDPPCRPGSNPTAAHPARVVMSHLADRSLNGPGRSARERAATTRTRTSGRLAVLGPDEALIGPGDTVVAAEARWAAQTKRFSRRCPLWWDLPRRNRSRIGTTVHNGLNVQPGASVRRERSPSYRRRDREDTSERPIARGGRDWASLVRAGWYWWWLASAMSLSCIVPTGGTDRTDCDDRRSRSPLWGFHLIR